MQNYLESMVLVMDVFVENNILSGNTLLLAANLQYTHIVDDLKKEFDARRWLQCVLPE